MPCTVNYHWNIDEIKLSDLVWNSLEIVEPDLQMFLICELLRSIDKAENKPGMRQIQRDLEN